jgi:hypothetical protein
MKIVVRLIGIVVGLGLWVLGFFSWMLSNDGIGSELVMKIAGAAMITAGIICVGLALFVPSKSDAPDEPSGPEPNESRAG